MSAAKIHRIIYPLIHINLNVTFEKLREKDRFVRKKKQNKKKIKMIENFMRKEGYREKQNQKL